MNFSRKAVLFPALFALVILSCNQPDKGPTTPSEEAGNKGIPAPANISWSVVNTYPHDTAAFTQGFEIYKGKIIESTGLTRRSTIRLVNLGDGKPALLKKNGDEVFGEGVTVLRDTAYQLTWQNHYVQLYKASDLSPIGRVNWSSEGWGITNDGTDLIISDGTDKLYFVHPGDLKLNRVLSVQDNLGPVNNLNELEYVNGYVYANRWQYDYIERIDPKSGFVVGRMDLKDMLKKYSKADVSYLTEPGSVGEQNGGVLNGIAWDAAKGSFLITGKLWPSVFEIKLQN